MSIMSELDMLLLEEEEDGDFFLRPVQHVASSAEASDRNSAETVGDNLDARLFQMGLPRMSLGNLGIAAELQNQLAATVNLILDRLHERKSVRHDLEDNLSRARDDVSQLELERQQARARIEQLEREAAKQTEEMRQLKLKLQRAQQASKEAEETARRAQANATQKITQFEHIRRRSEQEHDALKSKYDQMLRQRGSSNAFETLTELNRIESSGRGKWTKPQDGHQTLKSVLHEQLSERIQQLGSENDVLRDTLASLETDLVDMMKNALSIMSADTGDNLDESEYLNDGHFQLPVAMTQDRISLSIRNKMARLKQHVDGLHLTSNPAQLQQEVEELRAVVEQQQALLLNSSDHRYEEKSFLQPTPQKDRRAATDFQDQEQRLRRDREALDALAARLGKESDAIRAERLQLEKERHLTSSWLHGDA
ncbi:uncharacterized protein MONBRDRAFT_31849 [Monosiga brevicollis MX1]|uniref:Uncharacterized protein n=1 Tax=Monosiga brevicollis TaxID=81824 RepID=A9UVS7_MONBE|nr:uncharacterized protein MONBRDRAFT_31849 [Monosiga brevicollis MX1]EDQ90443.1 predicted protein [Monosiga brevicollis MX1]|eukprot:XP_001744494.1 hypothetical protein [Monosiga brevicollis MX1]